MDLTPKNNGTEELNFSKQPSSPAQAMISAVADSCSVRLDKVNRKVYKFHALVFNPGKFVLLYNFSGSVCRVN